MAATVCLGRPLAERRHWAPSGVEASRGFPRPWPAAGSDSPGSIGRLRKPPAVTRVRLNTVPASTRSNPWNSRAVAPDCGARPSKPRELGRPRAKEEPEARARPPIMRRFFQAMSPAPAPPPPKQEGHSNATRVRWTVLNAPAIGQGLGPMPTAVADQQAGAADRRIDHGQMPSPSIPSAAF